MNKTLRDSIIIGLALFATFFGAGNLIFPPFLGLQSGTEWFKGVVGFIASGVIMPVVAIYIISYAGGTVDSLTKKIHPKFSHLILLGLMIFSTLIAIPRTAAVTHELGIQALFPEFPIIPVIIVFFILTYYFVNDKNNVINKIGGLLTPALVVILVFIIVKGVLNPIAEPIETGISNAFTNALLGGYQTGDLLVSYMVASIFITDIINKGYKTEKQRNGMIAAAGVVAFICLSIIYAGLLYLGATGSSIYPQDIDRAELLLSTVRPILGSSGLYGLGIVVTLACLTTSIGLTTSVAQFFNEASKGKIKYSAAAGIVCIIGTFIALMGVDKIVVISTPIYLSIYPICIVVILVGLFYRYIPNTESYRGAVFMTGIISLSEALMSITEVPFLENLISSIPLSDMGFAWLIPSIIGFVGGTIIGLLNKQSVEKSESTI
ncbi:branched-chain amino acid transport system II carrier protein [Tissierellaceae bacterium HCP3S3_D8]